MNLTLELNVLLPALLAGLLVLATHVPLGQEVLKRGIVFIDLAIAQIAVLGVIGAEVLGFEAHGWAVQAIAASAALAGAALLSYTERRFAAQQEALIGVLFVLAASMALLLLHGHAQGAQHLKDVLEGQILWTEYRTLLPVALLSVFVLALWFGARRYFGRAGFYFLFALTVTASVQLVGVYLVFASLIIPALATARLPSAYVLGLMAYISGLAISLLADLPAAPVIVGLLTLFGAMVRWFTPPVRR